MEENGYGMLTKHYIISIKGIQAKVPAIRVGESIVIVKGKFLKIARIFDEYWIERRRLPKPEIVLNELQKTDLKPDLFAFSQRVPDIEPHYSFQLVYDNLAVIQLKSYHHWLNNQTSASVKRNIKASEKRGIVVRVSQFDDTYVRGIMSIYNETPVRQGRRFWHYGKNFTQVQEENATYSERSTFLAAYYKDEMIGYAKIVWDEQTAAIMQIMSRMQFYNMRPNNALLAEAVRQCTSRGIPYLLYEKFVYGNKTNSTLTEFKRSNGFVRMNIPRYYIPLTWKGAIALSMGFHIEFKERIPEWIMSPLRDFRTKWNERKTLNKKL
ncbi:MAG TPA: GNAT family N-acetyltransferase [Nitrospirota bacterium]|nr:GNAT family N-acetyltransferase [Nitrospirota bacterium]